MKVQLTLFFAIAFFFVSAYGQDKNPQVYCGRNLARVMAYVCDKFQQERKRSGYESLRLSYEPEHAWGWPWITASRADGGHERQETGLVGLDGIGGIGGLTNLRAPGKRGIVQDCCENPCSFDTLLNYC